TLARNAQERLEWQRESAAAREKLAMAETRMASGASSATRQPSTITQENSTVASKTTGTPLTAQTIQPAPQTPPGPGKSDGSSGSLVPPPVASSPNGQP